MEEKTNGNKRNSKHKGSVILIGGGEDKKGDKVILKELARRAGNGKLVTATVASEVAGEVWKQYDQIFNELGVKKVEHLDIERRVDAVRDPGLDVLKDAKVVFFTGGDQLKITTKLGGTAIAERILEIFEEGGTIAGTSAGASVMSQTMLVSGLGGESHKVGKGLLMAPGLGLVRDMIVDQHFAQRGRIGRLLGAIAQNPGVIGIGLDEDTAIIHEGDLFSVLGSGAVYVADGRGVTYTNISEEQAEKTMSIFDVRLHVLSEGDCFDLKKHRPKHV